MANEHISDAEARLRSVLESAPNAILTADRDGRIQFLNRAVHHRVDEIVGRTIYELVPSEDVERVRACVAHVLRTGEVSSYEIRYPRESGMRTGGRAFSVNVGPVRSGDAITGITLVSWDVTEQRELQARLMAADRLASVGLLAAGVAHEVNNPLTCALAHVRWALELLAEDDVPRSRALRERIEFALDGLQRISAIMRDLRSVARDDDDVSIAVDVNRVLDSSLRLAQQEVASRARVTRNYAELPPVRVAESRLAQVFVNLIVNAAQSMSNGTVEDNELCLSTGANGDGCVVIDIADTGTGIAPDLVDRVFDPFMTTKSHGVGTGLGLFVCARLMQEMGGRITIVRTDSKGTTFRVTVPIAPPSRP